MRNAAEELTHRLDRAADATRANGGGYALRRAPPPHFVRCRLPVRGQSHLDLDGLSSPLPLVGRGGGGGSGVAAPPCPDALSQPRHRRTPGSRTCAATGRFSAPKPRPRPWRPDRETPAGSAHGGARSATTAPCRRPSAARGGRTDQRTRGATTFPGPAHRGCCALPSHGHGQLCSVHRRTMRPALSAL
jgi:hypothetical protein